MSTKQQRCPTITGIAILLLLFTVVIGIALLVYLMVKAV